MQTSNYFAVFYAEHLYYIPQFLPVAKELKKRNLPFLFVVLKSSKRDIFDQNNMINEICEKEGLPYQIGEDGLSDIDIQYLICGGDNYPKTNISYEKSVLIVHGIGTKVSAFTEEKNKFDIRFIEGDFRLRRLKELYPNAKTIWENVGFSKLDDVFAYNSDERDTLYEKYQLDKKKPTLLYAPTFYPSSLEKMSDIFPEDFEAYNIIIKPHYYTYLRKKYKAQRNKLDKWAKYSNVYFAKFEDYSIIPFYTISDLLISDESSVVFEFAALDKPVICNRFLKLRLSYRLFGKYKLNKRMETAMNQFRDIGENVWKYKNLLNVVKEELKFPDNNKIRRAECTHEIIGPIDGKVSIRIVDLLEREKWYKSTIIFEKPDPLA